jgi:hypothetical protein
MEPLSCCVVDQGVDLLGRAHGKRKNAQRASEASLTWKKASRIVVEGPLSSFKTLIFQDAGYDGLFKEHWRFNGDTLAGAFEWFEH